MIKVFHTRRLFKAFLALVFFYAMENQELFGQAPGKDLEEADNLFLNNKYGEALPYYLRFLKNDSSNSNLNFKIGVCYLYSRSEKIRSIKYLTKSAGPSSPAVTYKFLGDAYIFANKFDQAMASYEKFKKAHTGTRSKDKSLIEEVNWKIEMCVIGKKLQELNTLQAHHVDYSSFLSPDQNSMTLIFEKSDTASAKLPADKKYFMDTYKPAATAGIPAAKTILDTTTNKNEAEVATSVNGQLVLIYKDENGTGNLYITKLSGNEWTVTEKLNKLINEKGWEKNESISPDGHTLYFTSDRPEGFGGKDIYYCKKTANGEWGKALNLGPVINTAADEEAPFIYTDQRTLFFSSNKFKKTCCFDNYKSTLSNDGTWSEPVKIGYPVKKASDGIFYAAADSSKEIPVTSIAKEANAENDFYLGTFVDPKKTPLTVLKGKLSGANGKVPSNGKIIITDNETSEVISTYNTDHKTGDYIITLPYGKNINVTYAYDGYLFHSENINADDKSGYKPFKIVQLSPITEGSKTELNNIFFDPDRATLTSLSNTELNNLVNLLSADTDTEAALSYFFVDSKENIFKEQLAMHRTEALVNYLTTKGINKERITAKKPEKLIPLKLKNNSGKKNVEVLETLTDRIELKITSIK